MFWPRQPWQGRPDPKGSSPLAHPRRPSAPASRLVISLICSRAKSRRDAFLWIRGPVIAVAVDVQDVHLVEASRLHQCLGGSNDDAAIASDQQRHVAWLVQNRQETITQDLPGDARSRPITDRRNFMMG